MNTKLNSELLQLAAIADERGYTLATDFLLDTVRPTQHIGGISSENLIAAVRMVFADRDKIQAIKLYRTLTGMGLRESKEWVERYVQPF